MVRVGIASFAHMHAMSYAGWLSKLPNVEFIGVIDDDSNRGRKCAEAFGVPFFADTEAFFDKKPQGVVVCGENARHLYWTEMAALNGANVLCEKPISTNLIDAKKMIDVCAENDVKLQIAFPCRYHTTAVRLKEIVESGRLGKVLAVKATNHGMMPGGWFADPDLAGGGAVIDHTVHVVDLLRWIFGAEVSSVYAEIGKLFNNDIRVDDAGILTLQFTNGIFATLDASWSRPKSFPTWGDVTIELVGTKGTLALDMFAQSVSVYSDSDMRSHWDNWGDDMDGGLVKAFIDMLETGEGPSISGIDGLRATEVALAAYDSSRTGKPVVLR